MLRGRPQSRRLPRPELHVFGDELLVPAERRVRHLGRLRTAVRELQLVLPECEPLHRHLRQLLHRHLRCREHLRADGRAERERLVLRSHLHGERRQREQRLVQQHGDLSRHVHRGMFRLLLEQHLRLDLPGPNLADPDPGGRRVPMNR